DLLRGGRDRLPRPLDDPGRRPRRARRGHPPVRRRAAARPAPADARHPDARPRLLARPARDGRPGLPGQPLAADPRGRPARLPELLRRPDRARGRLLPPPRRRRPDPPPPRRPPRGGRRLRRPALALAVAPLGPPLPVNPSTAPAGRVERAGVLA